MGQLYRQRLLVVDDDQDTRELFQFLLEAEGAEVKAVRTAAAALEVLSKWQGDALISDLTLPDSDGCALLTRLRSTQTGNQNIPAIAVSGWDEAEIREQILAAGFCSYLPKPVDSESLIAAVVQVTHPKTAAQ